MGASALGDRVELPRREERRVWSGAQLLQQGEGEPQHLPPDADRAQPLAAVQQRMPPAAGETPQIPKHDAGEVGGANPLHNHESRHSACARRDTPQVHLAGVPYALTGNGWPDGPEHAPGQAPSEPRRVAALCPRGAVLALARA